MTKNTIKKNLIYLWYILITAAVVILDHVTKWLAVESIRGKPDVVLINGVFRLTYCENTGMAFSLFSENTLVLAIITLIALLALAAYTLSLKQKKLNIQTIGMMFILGGGIGNLVDRFFSGYVVDFFDFYLINFAVFNVADTFVTVGAGLFILSLITQIINEKNKEA